MWVFINRCPLIDKHFQFENVDKLWISDESIFRNGYTGNKMIRDKYNYTFRPWIIKENKNIDIIRKVFCLKIVTETLQILSYRIWNSENNLLI